MFHEGIYALTLRDCASSVVPSERYEVEVDSEGSEALAIVRNGTILGSDRWGGLFSGTYMFNPVTGRTDVRVRLEVPAEAELITGFAAGPEATVFDIVAALDWTAPKSAATVMLQGKPVNIEFSFIGSLQS